MGDNWWTNQQLYDFLCERHKMQPELDVAADKDNRKCKNYFTKENDALTKDWVLEEISTDTTVKRKLIRKVDVWCNCPNSKLKDFIQKAFDQWYMHNINILMIVPCQVFASKAFINTVWKEVCTQKKFMYPVGFEPIFPRPKFYDGDNKTNPKDASWFAYMTVVFRKRAE